ncbi:hypothetical protein BN7_4283 [Wickerhamomyces ciferrii]|uniref:Uncharacterized protein n=1 Tax=Wickerhamomyces ciferrii (strain ATCC 14091 / BCRC 22168 / CBS 111 / JCM 3599 / NBRC 0793 / NRRL Y-1031 F-60-10) TaxID=1206466 RepID=K0KHN1_WICCF|nr:uncharacterized protein BN7_4283 [Wickerhamomyces ciferrii]CCH44715.1 hypothetical protein BN7_4283 [Wickerhamomyces ciferrii]
MSLEQQAQDRKRFDLPPTVQDENLETVEAVSQKIQDDILKKFQSTVDQNFAEAGKDNLKVENIRKKAITSDLMRDLQPKLDVLNERTNESIQKILKERIRKLREDVTTTN